MYDALTFKYFPCTGEVYMGSLEDINRADQKGNPVAYVKTSSILENIAPTLNDTILMAQSNMIHGETRITIPEIDVQETLDELRVICNGKTNSETIQHLNKIISEMGIKNDAKLEKFQKYLYFITCFQSTLLLSRFPAYPRNYSLLHSMFVVENLPQLHARIPPQIAFEMSGPFNLNKRMSNYIHIDTKVPFDLQEYFIQVPFLFSNYYDSVDILNSYKEKQIACAVAKKYNEASFEALKKIQANESLDARKFEGNDKSNIHDSSNSIIDEIRNILNSYRIAGSTITHIAMSIKLFRYLTKVEPSTLTNPNHLVAGLHMFPGIPSIIAVVDPLLDTDNDGCVMYAVDQMNAICGQGPIIMQNYAGNSANTYADRSLGCFYDFFQYKIIHRADLNITDGSKKEFAFKMHVSF